MANYNVKPSNNILASAAAFGFAFVIVYVVLKFVGAIWVFPLVVVLVVVLALVAAFSKAEFLGWLAVTFFGAFCSLRTFDDILSGDRVPLIFGAIFFLVFVSITAWSAIAAGFSQPEEIR